MNTKNAKIKSMRAAKERKQKKLALVLGGLFLVLLVVQGPRTLKMLRGNGSSTPPATPASSPQTPASQAPASATPVATSAGSTQLPESDVPPRRTRSQLFSFELFESKDPFAQQVSQSAPPVATAVAPAASAPVQPAAVAAGTDSATPPPSQAASASVSSSGASASKTAAVIEVNGQRQAVEVSQDFPAVKPTFRLVSFNGNVAMIGIAGGSYASGSRAIALRAGRTVTLMNTSDGQRYELRLVSVR